MSANPDMAAGKRARIKAMKAKKAENDASRGFSLGSGFDGLRRPLEEHQRAVTGTGEMPVRWFVILRVLATGDSLL